MDKKMQKKFSEAYDKMYDLNSASGYKFVKIMDMLDIEVMKLGYKFKLSSTQKFKCVKED